MIDEVINTLDKRGVEYSREEVVEKFKMLTEQFRISAQDAAASIINFYTRGKISISQTSDLVQVKNISSPDQWVTIEGVVTAILPSNNPAITQSGLINDGTGVIRYVIWQKSGHSPLEQFKAYRLENVVTSEFNGSYSVSVNRNSHITAIEKEIPGLSADSEFSMAQNVKIGEINAPDKWVTLKGKVIKIFQNASSAITQQGVIADETGSVRYVIWKKAGVPPLEEGKSYEMDSVVTGAFNDRYSVYVNSLSEVRELDEDIHVELTRKFSGVVVSISDGSGIVKRCPDCNRVLQKGMCPQHGKVNGENDLRIKLVVDNGVDYRDVIIPRALVESVTGITFEQAMQLLMETFDNEAIMSRFREMLVGKYVIATGRDIDKMIIAESFSLDNITKDDVMVLLNHVDCLLEDEIICESGVANGCRNGYCGIDEDAWSDVDIDAEEW